MTGRDPLAERMNALLAEHSFYYEYTAGETHRAECIGCDWSIPWETSAKTLAFDAHLADVLAATARGFLSERLEELALDTYSARAMGVEQAHGWDRAIVAAVHTIRGDQE